MLQACGGLCVAPYLLCVSRGIEIRCLSQQQLAVANQQHGSIRHSEAEEAAGAGFCTCEAQHSRLGPASLMFSATHIPALCAVWSTPLLCACAEHQAQQSQALKMFSALLGQQGGGQPAAASTAAPEQATAGTGSMGSLEVRGTVLSPGQVAYGHDIRVTDVDLPHK